MWVFEQPQILYKTFKYLVLITSHKFNSKKFKQLL
jgi:hypothetical protein